jgi:hypothetical protein
VKQQRRSRSRAMLLLLGFFAIILGGPVLISAVYRAIVGPPKRTSRRVQRPRIQVRALYDFEGQTPEDLKFQKGEIITIRRKVSDGWLEGELPNGTVGLVPEPYVQPITPPPQTAPRSASMPSYAHSQQNSEPFVEGINEQDFLAQNNVF